MSKIFVKHLMLVLTFELWALFNLTSYGHTSELDLVVLPSQMKDLVVAKLLQKQTCLLLFLF
jgi:hypothetical protein